jgi:hypothetical protein
MGQRAKMIHKMARWLEPYFDLSLRAIICHFLAALVSIGLIGLPLVLILNRDLPIVPVSFSVVYPYDGIVPGEKFTILWHVVQQRTGCSGTVEREIISGDVIHSFTVDKNSFNDTGALGDHYYTKDIIAPLGLLPGNGFYVSRVTWWCNPVQKYLWPIKTINTEPITIKDR